MVVERSINHCPFIPQLSHLQVSADWEGIWGQCPGGHQPWKTPQKLGTRFCLKVLSRLGRLDQKKPAEKTTTNKRKTILEKCLYIGPFFLIKPLKNTFHESGITPFDLEE